MGKWLLWYIVNWFWLFLRFILALVLEFLMILLICILLRTEGGLWEFRFAS